MPQRYSEAIVKYLASRDYTPLKPRQLARQMGVAEEDYGTFRAAVKRLRDGGRVVLGAKNALTLPEISKSVVGRFRANPRGFGFVIPETPNSHGDLFIPPDATGGAMTGDRVMARVMHRGKRDGENVYAGKIIKIYERGKNRFAGTLQKADNTWFVLPDGKEMTTAIVIHDIGTAGPREGEKVVAEIVKYGSEGVLPTGVIVERLGEQGEIVAETLAVIRAHGLDDEFSAEALEDARAAVESFDPSSAAGRDDLSEMTIVTIDPPDARDFDDAISLQADGDGSMILGVHIADVSHFVREGTQLDAEAKTRGTSVYFPRRVVPMLPEILSNGVCSLQEAQPRFAKSAFIKYDANANVVGSRFAESVVTSARRLTYDQAQEICDGKTGGHRKEVVDLVRRMEALARKIEDRRRRDGMLHLDLPDVELVFDDADRVIDAVPEDQSYSHTIIEMFMVEANEAVARLLDRKGRSFLRRVHPQPDPAGRKHFASFVRACGHKVPADAGPKELQQLLDAVRGKPESYAVNLAVLKTFEQAEYSPMQIGHFALASQNYCHFTSPIRRYPDLTVHRLLASYCRNELDDLPPDDVSALTELGEQLTEAENTAEAAERELREVLVLQFLATKVGEGFDGVITGVTNFGIFVQSPRFLVEGLVRMEDLGDDWWEVNARYGMIRGEHSGRKYRIGDVIGVRISSVDVAQRKLNLVPQRDLATSDKTGKKSRGKSETGGGKSGGKDGGKPKGGGKSGKGGRKKSQSRRGGGRSQGKGKAKGGSRKPKGAKRSQTGKPSRKKP